MSLISDVVVAVKQLILPKGSELKCFEGHSKGITAVDFSHDGSMVASGGNDATVRVFDTNSGKQRHCFTLSSDSIDIQRVAFSKDGTRLLAVGMHLGGFGKGGGLTYLFDLKEGRELKRFEGKPHLVVSPNGRHVISTSRDTTIRVWEFDTGREISRLVGHAKEVTALAVSPDGKYCLSGSVDTSIRMWNMEAFQEERRFIGHMDAITSVAFGPTQTLVVSAGMDSTIRTWNFQTAGEVHRFDSMSHLDVKVCFGFGGRRVHALCPDAIRRWDTKSGQTLTMYRLEQNAVSHVCFSRNGNMAIVCFNDGSIVLLDMESLKEIKKLTGHTWAINCAAFDHTDTHMITGSGDSTARYWSIPSVENPSAKSPSYYVKK